MKVSEGQRLPDAKLIEVGPEGWQEAQLADLVAGRKVVIFGLPGAYTRTCTAAHLPSFVRTAERFRERGIDAIYCVAVNDAHVMKHWAETSGAFDAGIVMLADWDSELAKALGLAFSAPAVGFKDRMVRCAMIVEDGVIRTLQVETERGVCDLTSGETLLAAL